MSFLLGLDLKLDASPLKRKAFATELLKLFEVLKLKGREQETVPQQLTNTHVSTSNAMENLKQSNAAPESSVCAKCGTAATDTYCKAMGKVWHTKCFVCTICEKPIENQFLVHNGLAYCPEDFNKTFTKMCNGCGEKIEGAFVRVDEKDWHSNW